ncbi:dTMP kinase [Sphingorhabdus sp. IMCC26285]|uniref:Thymidylate kinase n=1 Tax=Sphingorhabdus profundilacus TaxID=2509718 RepID=A0A6I4LXW1_9SPHN|nr:dTMP kinase [Sphingorhabdus profundilacus]MVZ96933.1 dTMP kinase [Sphingorhabdus profundilacus]
MNARGRFLSVEGGEGVGKSTQILALADAIRQAGHDVVITREPGGTSGAETIRQLVLGGSAERWYPRAEALLFAAARSDHVERLIKPALESGKWVISDRFLDSSRAYQGGGSGLSDADILTLHQIGSRGLLPDRTLVLRLDSGEAIRRASARDAGQADRIQGRNSAFHSDVDNAFVSFAETDPRVRLVDASGEPKTVTARLLSEISDLLIKS